MLKGLRLTKCWKNFRRRQKRQRLILHGLSRLVKKEGFTRELIEAGDQITRHRHELLPRLAPLVTQSYRRLAGDVEDFQLQYQPAVKSDFAVELAQSRGRERAVRSTVVGPHRDELLLSIQGRSVEAFGSEGQKRSVTVALKMAQAEYLTSLHGSPPVLLIDDIMGELDARRRSAFVPLLHRVDQAGSQVFMTATQEGWPQELGRDLHKWQVKAGELAKQSMVRFGQPVRSNRPEPWPHSRVILNRQLNHGMTRNDTEQKGLHGMHRSPGRLFGSRVQPAPFRVIPCVPWFEPPFLG